MGDKLDKAKDPSARKFAFTKAGPASKGYRGKRRDGSDLISGKTKPLFEQIQKDRTTHVNDDFHQLTREQKVERFVKQSRIALDSPEYQELQLGSLAQEVAARIITEFPSARGRNMSKTSAAIEAVKRSLSPEQRRRTKAVGLGIKVARKALFDAGEQLPLPSTALVSV